MFVPVLWFLLPCWALIVNVTIDDGNGDAQSGRKVEYTPNWYTTRDHGPKNVTRWWGIHLALAHDHTLSQALYGPGNVTLRFIGTAIYVFFVVRNFGGSSDVRLTFYLDGGPEPITTYFTANFDDWQYNHLVFQRDSLKQSNHSLIVESNTPALFFDYAIYTADNSTLLDDPSNPDPLALTSSSSGPSTTPGILKPHAALAKIVVPVVFVAALTLGIFCWTLSRRRRHRRSREHTTAWQEPEGLGDREADASALARADARTEKAVTPYVEQPQLDEKPETTVPKQRLMDDVLGPKQSDDTGGRIAPLPVASQGPNNGRTRTEGGPKRRAILEMLLALDPLSPTPQAGQARDESTADIRAELERLRAEAEEARAENEMLRQAVEPPPYSDGGQSERGSPLVGAGRL